MSLSFQISTLNMLELKPLRIQPSNLGNFVTLDNRKTYANFVSILVFPPFYFYHFWGVTCLPIEKLTHEHFVKHMNVPITCLYT